MGCLREPRDLEPRDLPLAPARPPEAGQYRPRRCTAKPPKQRQGQRGREPRQGRALREHGLSEPRTRLQPQHRSAHPPANGAEETSQPAGFHGCCFSRGIGDLLTLGTVVYAKQDALLPTKHRPIRRRSKGRAPRGRASTTSDRPVSRPVRRSRPVSLFSSDARRLAHVPGAPSPIPSCVCGEHR